VDPDQNALHGHAQTEHHLDGGGPMRHGEQQTVLPEAVGAFKLSTARFAPMSGRIGAAPVPVFVGRPYRWA
jgi:hypothetical protein